MHILTKVHHKPQYVHGFMSYPRVFIPLAQDRQFCSLQVLLSLKSPAQTVPFYPLHFFNTIWRYLFFSAMDALTHATPADVTF